MRSFGRCIGALAQTCVVVAIPVCLSCTAATTASTDFHVRRMYATSTAGSGNGSIDDSSGSNPNASTDARMQSEIFRKALEAKDSHDPTSAAATAALFSGGNNSFTEERHTTPGTSHEDAFGHTDPLMAVEQTVQEVAQNAQKVAEEKYVNSEQDDEHSSLKKRKEELASEIDQVVSGRNRRRNRRKRSMDAILGDVLHDALRMRDMGEKPTSDFVYKRAQERMYEEEYGKKPPTAKETAAQYIPFPPDFHLRRLLPLLGDTAAVENVPAETSMSTEAAELNSDAVLTEATQRSVKQAPIYTKNHMNMHALVPPDPWPERSITPDNPVWTRRMVADDKQKTGGKGLKEWEERMFAPRPGYDLVGELVDALDELAHWENQFLTFVRTVPISQRRSLPFLHEWYRLLVHRLVRAERRYIRIRDALVAQTKASTAVFARTEKIVEDVRSYYAETHRSLASPNYDPLRMKKSVLAPVLRMTDAEYEEWQEMQRRMRNALVADLS